MEVSMNVVRGFASVLRELSVDFPRLMREAGIDFSLFERSQDPVELNVAERLMRAAFGLTPEPGLGLHFGARAPLQTLGMLGEVLTHSPTLRAAIADLHAYLPLVFPLSRFQLIEEGDRAFLIYEPPFSDHSAARFCTELSFAFAIRIAQQLIPGFTPLEVRVRHRAPHYFERYNKVMGCPVRFDSTRSEIVLLRSALDTPQPFVDDVLWRVLKRRADELLLQERARELALSELSNPEVPIKRIADRVGFSEVSAFHRAFKRWTGVTPARYRAQAFLAHAS